MRIFIEDSFDSAHFLPNVPQGHKCSRMHGHTYRIRIEVAGPVGPQGWIIDYSEVKQVWCGVRELLDHRTLNDIYLLHNPTCEHIAKLIWDHMKPSVPGLCRIELRETERCGVVYEGE